MVRKMIDLDYDPDEVRRNYYYMKYKGVIHDGVTEEFSMFTFLYPIFVFTGLSIFLWILMKYAFVKDKVKGNK